MNIPYLTIDLRRCMECSLRAGDRFRATDFLLALAGVILVNSLGCSGNADSGTPSASKAGGASVKPKASVVVSKPVVMPIVEWDEFVGRLAPVDSVQVRSRVSGYLASTNFAEGQLVHRGDVIAVIDQRPFLAEIQRGRANLEESKAKWVQAQSQVALAQAEATRATIVRDLAKKQLDRNDELRKQDATTVQESEIRQAEFAQAEADIIVANSQIASAESAAIAAQASVGIAQANLELAELNLSYTEIRAPIDGRIGQRLVTEGNLVSGGTNDSTLLTTIVSLHPIHCYFDADEQTYLRYSQLSRDGKRPNNRELRNPIFLALSNERDGFPYRGYIDFIDNRMDEKTGTIRGRAILPNEDFELTPGLFARVRVPGSPRYEAILVPDKAIATDQAEKFVLTVDDHDKVERKVVTLGRLSHGLRIIRTGLVGNERIVLSGQQKARPGTQVTVTSTAIVAEKDQLPDEYEPVSSDQLFTKSPMPAGNVSPPKIESSTPESDQSDVQTQRTARALP